MFRVLDSVCRKLFNSGGSLQNIPCFGPKTQTHHKHADNHSLRFSAYPLCIWNLVIHFSTGSARKILLFGPALSTAVLAKSFTRKFWTGLIWSRKCNSLLDTEKELDKQSNQLVCRAILSKSLIRTNILSFLEEETAAAQSFQSPYSKCIEVIQGLQVCSLTFFNSSDRASTSWSAASFEHHSSAGSTRADKLGWNSLKQELLLPQKYCRRLLRCLRN